MMLGAPPNTIWRYLGYPVNYYWIANWVILTPILLVAVLIFLFIGYDDKWDTIWGSILGWGLTFGLMLPIPLYAIYSYVTNVTIGGKDPRYMITPTEAWIPQSERIAKIPSMPTEMFDTTKAGVSVAAADNAAYEGSAISLTKIDKHQRY